VLAACGGDDLPGPDVAAQVDGQAILYADFESYLTRNLGEAETGLSSVVLSRLFDRFLDEALLWRLAEGQGVVQPDGPRDLNIRMILLDRAIEIADADVARYYDENIGDYDLAERVQLRQVLVRDQAAAGRIREALLGGQDFYDAVAAEEGGESDPFLGEQKLTREHLPAAVRDFIFALAPGEVSEVVAADYGYHVFQVTERWPAERVPLERVADDIRGILHGERAEGQLQGMLAEAREEYDVRVFERNLPFNYEGRLQESADEVDPS